MWQWFYNLSIVGFHAGVGIASLFHAKARMAITGRRTLEQRLAEWRKQHPGRLYWFHCASLGEFEQGRSLIEAFRKQAPKAKLLLTFFSPSGYEIRKNFPAVDYVTYLPFDHPRSMKKLVSIVQADAVFTVKYEFWVNWFRALHKSQTPLFVISAKLRENQRFFGRFGAWWQQTLACVTHFYTQDNSTTSLLHGIGLNNSTLTGDTRFDRVIAIQQGKNEIPELKTWCNNQQVLVIGSSWESETKLALQCALEHPDWKIIIVPHEINENVISQLASDNPATIRYSQMKNISDKGQVMIVDTVGLLSKIYQLAQVVIIGGGFGKGIHNTLEAAVWGKPILFGPRFEKFSEAIELIEIGAAFGLNSPEDLKHQVKTLMKEVAVSKTMGDKAAEYVKNRGGATEKIMQHPEIQRLLKI